MTPRPTFEFCALSFLTQWQKDECALHSAFSLAPTEKDIRKALRYFKIARTFKGLNSPGRVGFILSYLRDVRNDQKLSSSQKVYSLARDFQKTFDTFNISAASKLLWLSDREPFIVYDGRAVNALTRFFHHKFQKNSYIEYADVWREEYLKSTGLIQVAVEQLPKGRKFMRYSSSLSDKELVSMAKEAWFMERVFDIFLWEVGTPKRPTVANLNNSSGRARGSPGAV
jgi:hypothetical protein